MEVLRKFSFVIQKKKDTDTFHDPTISSNNALLKNYFFEDFNRMGLAWLFSVAPGFALDGNKISVLHEPGEFYETLVNKCRSANQRITFASLYIGTGTLEEQLISAIDNNLKNANGQLKVKVLLDFTRGSRGVCNSRTMLLPLLNRHSESFHVSLYHTPALRGPLRCLIPQRYNELVGLQHMKLYLFDNSLLISGANLSHDYFTNRQDRYILIEDCASIADFYDNLVSRVCEFSFQLDGKNETQLSTSWPWHPYKSSYINFEKKARENVWKLFETAWQGAPNRAADTWLFPLIEMGQLGIHHDSRVTSQLFTSAVPNSSIHLSTGYFNLTPQYMDAIVHDSVAQFHILMAHPSANGFLGARGPAGGIPSAYTQLASRFLHMVESCGAASRVQLHEFRKPRWTFHGKGLWYTLPGLLEPVLTLVGSPNFGVRSVSRDLESQLAIVTTNSKLQKNLCHERQKLFQQSEPFTRETLSRADRVPPLWVRIAAWLFRHYF